MTMTRVRMTINPPEPGRGRVVSIRVQSLPANEAGVYEHVLSPLTSSSDRLPAPRYFGYFEDLQDRRALVTEYVGPALESFDGLTEKTK
ncbi:MAG: hypothetical protein M1826_000416 [Phylliscum demangeonii]|nr:MAG: hypothetical protein M1826_000416 [Phylliscum demangeonii]